ncbi:hypothetical protein P1N98_12895, partial [Tsukamurella tyrosinosolvens]
GRAATATQRSPSGREAVTPSRIAANLDLFGFTLDDAEIAAIDALEADGRTGPHPAAFNG